MNDKDQNNTQRTMKETMQEAKKKICRLERIKHSYKNDEPYKKVTLRNKIITKIHWMIKF